MDPGILAPDRRRHRRPARLAARQRRAGARDRRAPHPQRRARRRRGRLRGRPHPEGGDRGRDGRQPRRPAGAAHEPGAPQARGTLNRTGTVALFTNQLREKIGVMFGSPETTPGGRALKFYSSVRLDIRRIETLKEGVEAIGNRVRVKVVKNKVPRPSSRPSSTSSTARASPGRAASSTSAWSGSSCRSRLVLQLRRRAARTGPAERHRVPQGAPGRHRRDPPRRPGRARPGRRRLLAAPADGDGAKASVAAAARERSRPRQPRRRPRSVGEAPRG